MSNITGGSVKYGRTVKTGDFENKRVDVELTFNVGEGEDHAAVLQAAAKEAHEKAHAMLGIKPASAQTAAIATEPKPEKQPTKEASAAAMNAADAEKKKPGPKPKAKEEPKPEVKPAVAPEGEDIEGFDEDAAETQPEITDTALSAAMNRKVAELKPAHGGAAPKLIKELINKFVEPPKKSHDIPQNLRAEFLKKLEALK